MKSLIERFLERLGFGEQDYISLDCTDTNCAVCLACDHKCHNARATR